MSEKIELKEVNMKIYNRFTKELIIEVEDVKTNLRDANLRDANLSGANLSRAKTDKEIIFFQFNRDVLQKIGNEIGIGCEVHTVKHWLMHGKKIGKENNYTAKEIKKYMDFIKFIGG